MSVAEVQREAIDRLATSYAVIADRGAWTFAARRGGRARRTARLGTRRLGGLDLGHHEAPNSIDWTITILSWVGIAPIAAAIAAAVTAAGWRLGGMAGVALGVGFAFGYVVYETLRRGRVVVPLISVHRDHTTWAICFSRLTGAPMRRSTPLGRLTKG